MQVLSLGRKDLPQKGRSPGGGNGNPFQQSCLEKSHGQRNLAGQSPQGCKESDMIEHIIERSQNNCLPQGPSGILWAYFQVLRCSIKSNSLQSYSLQPARLLCPRNSPGKNTGVGCHFLFQDIFPIQGIFLGCVNNQKMLLGGLVGGNQGC